MHGAARPIGSLLLLRGQEELLSVCAFEPKVVISGLWGRASSCVQQVPENCAGCQAGPKCEVLQGLLLRHPDPCFFHHFMNFDKGPVPSLQGLW